MVNSLPSNINNIMLFQISKDSIATASSVNSAHHRQAKLMGIVEALTASRMRVVFMQRLKGRAMMEVPNRSHDAMRKYVILLGSG